MEGGPNWFLSHRSLGWAGVSIATAGMVVGRAIATGGERATSHRLIGYAATLMGLAQPVIAYFRGKMTPDEKRQPLFAGGPSWCASCAVFGSCALLRPAVFLRLLTLLPRYALHKYLGWLCIALGLYNIRLGIKMHDPDRALSTVYSRYVYTQGSPCCKVKSPLFILKHAAASSPWGRSPLRGTTRAPACRWIRSASARAAACKSKSSCNRDRGRRGSVV